MTYRCTSGSGPFYLGRPLALLLYYMYLEAFRGHDMHDIQTPWFFIIRLPALWRSAMERFLHYSFKQKHVGVIINV